MPVLLVQGPHLEWQRSRCSSQQRQHCLPGKLLEICGGILVGLWHLVSRVRNSILWSYGESQAIKNCTHPVSIRVPLGLYVSEKLVCSNSRPEFTLLCTETQPVLNLLEMQGPSKSTEDCTVFYLKLY